MTWTPDHSDLRLELYVRSLCPHGAYQHQETVIKRLERLDAEGVIEGFDVRVWGKQVAPSTAAARTQTGELALDRFEAFKRWAETHDRSIASFFELRSVESSLSGEQYTAIVFPALALAEFQDDDLQHVAPCSDGETMHTVEDRVDALERDLLSLGAQEENRHVTMTTADNGN